MSIRLREFDSPLWRQRAELDVHAAYANVRAVRLGPRIKHAELRSLSSVVEPSPYKRNVGSSTLSASTICHVEIQKQTGGMQKPGINETKLGEKLKSQFAVERCGQLQDKQL